MTSKKKKVNREQAERENMLFQALKRVPSKMEIANIVIETIGEEDALILSSMIRARAREKIKEEQI